MSDIAGVRATSGGPRRVTVALSVAGVAVLSSVIVGWTLTALIGNPLAPWLFARAAGVTSYLLLVALVIMGLLLSHPWRTRVLRPSSANRIRLHLSLAVFTLMFTVLHIVVLATDQYAGVGVMGALVPMGSAYRPLPVTFGVLGVYAGLLAGLTAGFAGGIARRVWWPVHKVAVVSVVLVWVHGILAGSDSAALTTMYVGSGALVLAVAVSRYTARTPTDRAVTAAAQAALPGPSGPSRSRA